MGWQSLVNKFFKQFNFSSILILLLILNSPIYANSSILNRSSDSVRVQSTQDTLISDPTLTPSNPTEVDDINIALSAVDVDGMKDIVLNYDYNSIAGGYIPINMTSIPSTVIDISPAKSIDTLANTTSETVFYGNMFANGTKTSGPAAWTYGEYTYLSPLGRGITNFITSVSKNGEVTWYT